ncbi:MAG TPA: hypothetical protein VG944_13525, partial [Fimbriimonas sp.]|nr:hypothetical protein [Fimbriimonas sp.]
AIHVRQHCVANLPPNPGRYRMLFATGKARRRLLLPGDPVDSRRDGKILPDPNEVPPQYRELIDWAKQRYESARETKSVYEKLIELRGTGKGLWPEGADQFIRELRKDWE